MRHEPADDRGQKARSSVLDWLSYYRHVTGNPSPSEEEGARRGREAQALERLSGSPRGADFASILPATGSSPGGGNSDRPERAAPDRRRCTRGDTWRQGELRLRLHRTGKPGSSNGKAEAKTGSNAKRADLLGKPFATLMRQRESEARLLGFEGVPD